MIESFDAWWSGLSAVTKFFYLVGTIASLALVVQTVLTLAGLDSTEGADATDSQFDFHTGDGGHSGLGFLSVRTITAFLAGFGWVGAILLRSAASLWLAFPVALAAGCVLMLLVFYLMKLLWSLRQSGTLDYHNAIGETGKVYLPIPGNREGKGQIEVMMQGRLQTVPAVTSHSARLENRSRVLVVDILEDNTLVVVPDEMEEN